MKKNLKKNVCVYIYVYSRITLLYIWNERNTEINYTPIKKKKKTHKEKKSKMKRHNSSFYLSVITWNVNYFAWRKSSQ